jgi:low temperature requirement protein LtrA
MELFFDLVYVFAVTQLSRYLYDHLTARGALETLVLFLAVWWAWNYTAWASSWIDPDTVPVRMLLLGLMFLSLIMSAVAGNSLFKFTLLGRPQVSRLVAIAVLALLAPLAAVVDPLALSTAAAVVTVALALVLGRSGSGEVAAAERP